MEKDNIEELSQKIIDLLIDNNIWRNASSHALKNSERFSEKRVINDLKKYIENI